jgi:hypothetical protein
MPFLIAQTTGRNRRQHVRHCGVGAEVFRQHGKPVSVDKLALTTSLICPSWEGCSMQSLGFRW